MGTVIPFPGVSPAEIRPRPTCMDDLRPGARALVVVPAQRGFDVVMRPALNANERAVRQSFATAREALVFARRTSASFPRLYQLVLDESGVRSLDALLGPGADAMDFGGAA
jgi:hypothetical protein